MLTVFQKGFITLVRAGVIGKGDELPEDFDVERIYDAARLHHLMGIVYKGAVLCGVDKSLPVMQKLFLGAIKEAAVHERQLHEYADLRNCFKENGIAYMPIKGILIKELYPEPALRYMNDVDILIHKSDYKEIEKILLEREYTFRCESDHEYIWVKKGTLNLELHKDLVASANEDFYEYLSDYWNRAHKRDDFEHYLSKEDEFIYLFCHFSKHYRLCGIGVKYLIDLWLYSIKRKLDEEYVEKEFNKIGILEFYNNIKKVMKFWFEDGELDEKTEFITNYIIISGAYGTHENEIASLVLQKHKAKFGFGTMAKVKLFVMRTFPTLSIMKIHHKYLEKVPFLLPFSWVQRWINAIFNKRKNIARHFNDIKNIEDSRVEELSKQLEYVGLNFKSKR